MTSHDLERQPSRAAELCRDAHQRLLQRLDGLSPTTARSASRLPGWSIAHVISHLARNADAHERRLTGALTARDVPKYLGGPDQRRAEIEIGARQDVTTLIHDLTASQTRLELAMDRCAHAGWPNDHLLGDGTYPVLACPAHRLREVEMHHVDLGLGYEPEDWPMDYVAWDLPNLLASAAERIPSAQQRRRMTAWLAGRSPALGHIALTPW